MESRCDLPRRLLPSSGRLFSSLSVVDSWTLRPGEYPPRKPEDAYRVMGAAAETSQWGRVFPTYVQFSHIPRHARARLSHS